MNCHLYSFGNYCLSSLVASVRVHQFVDLIKLVPPRRTGSTTHQSYYNRSRKNETYVGKPHPLALDVEPKKTLSRDITCGISRLVPEFRSESDLQYEDFDTKAW